MFINNVSKKAIHYFSLITLIIFLLFAGCYRVPLLPNNQAPKIDLNAPCWQHTLKTYNTTAKSVTQLLDDEILDYQSVVEQSLSYRTEMIEVAKRLKDNLAQDKPLSGYDLDTLTQGTVAYLALRKNLYKVTESYKCWWEASADTFEQAGIKTISPENQLKGVMLSLSAALMLYDNYLFAISVFEEDEKLRRFLNERDAGYGIGKNELANITQAYHSSSTRIRVKQALNFYEERQAKLSTAFRKDPGFSYLKLLIEQSASYNMTKEYSPLYAIGEKLQFMGAMTDDTLHYLATEGENLFSQFFGNTVGLVEFRKGKLYNRTEVLNQVTNQLQAGDILLEKTPFRLTDKFIPGYWGHAAIWIGTEVELKELGIWEDPLVKQYHDNIRQGHGVVEALRAGVQMSSLPHFLNIDDLVILRNTKLDKKALAERIILALRQVGKAYDFNFDVETTDKIVCSELIYVVYIGIQWPTDKTLGRFTISPDNVASKALKGEPLKLISFFHDGQLVAHHPLELMSQLLEEQ